MDIGVKERVIGAVVLVVLGIIIIPWVLEGPAPGRSVTKNVPLPAAATTAAPSEYRMPLAEPPAASAAPTVNSPLPPTTQVGSVSPSTTGTTKSTSPSSASVKAQPISRQRASVPAAEANGKWMVQAGSYSRARNAIELERTLKKHGYHVVVSQYSTGQRTYFRVRVGPYPDSAAARKVVPEINRIYGGKAKVVPNS